MVVFARQQERKEISPQGAKLNIPAYRAGYVWPSDLRALKGRNPICFTPSGL
jgi:hypothetical protein